MKRLGEKHKFQLAKYLPEELRHLKGVLLEYSHCPPCVYFLLDGRKLVYIGQSVNFGSRVYEHIGRKKFSRVVVLPVEIEDLSELEGALIRTLWPKLNGNTGPLPIEPGRVLRKYGFDHLIPKYDARRSRRDHLREVDAIAMARLSELGKRVGRVGISMGET